jgi:putative DNA methylase
MTMTSPIKTPKKLIEVALPLDAINIACAREKSIRHGHPSTLHLWWARRPLAAARAVIFSQMVNDPSWKWEIEHPGEVPPNNLKASWAASRKRLFGILEELVKWESTTKEEVLKKARLEIVKSWRETCELNRDHPQASTLFNPDKLPAFHDPFAGGGAIPLEAQRLGLEAYASDLNPVAVLINKAMIEIPPRFAGKPPVNPNHQQLLAEEKVLQQWHGAQGLAEDVRYYGQWMRDEAEKRIGHLYPKMEITADMATERPDLVPYVGKKLTVIAWLWARTVKSPNPAFSHVEVPLVSTFMLSTKEGKEAYVEPVIEGDSYRFTIRTGKPKDGEAAKNGTKLARGANFRCIVSDIPIPSTHIYGEAVAGRMGSRLMAIVAEGKNGRVYIPPSSEMEAVALRAKPDWKPEMAMPENPRWFSPPLYGLTTYGDLFTPRQLVALTTFSDLVAEAREKVRQDAIAAGVPDDEIGIDTCGSNAKAYAEAVSVYLAIAGNKLADRGSTVCSWDNTRDSIRNTFGRQAIPMVWDFAESNILSESSGSLINATDQTYKSVFSFPCHTDGSSEQVDAQTQSISSNKVISTDPPYYDNIGYADLSDFFYVWLRRTLKPTFPALFATLAVPKAEELVATPYRHGNKEKAEAFFLNGMTHAMHRMAEQAHPTFPVTIYYAFKQAETKDITGTSSTGWETFLEAVIKAGFAIGGTWPMRTELGNRMIGSGTNALASSIVLVCRARPADAPTISRRVFLRELNTVLPEALDSMIRGAEGDHSPVAPVDLSQAIIGPGMAVFSKYAAVLEADGSQMTVKAALQLINRFLAEGDFDPDTQFCLQWFEQNGWREGKFGDADTLARAKGTSVEGVRQSGVVQATGGVVRLLKWADYQQDWNPATDTRLPVWEALHQVIRIFNQGGESAAGAVLSAIPGQAEAARQLAYRLYTLCERAGMAEDARAYNEIITSWNAIEAAATREPRGQQGNLFEFL